MKRAGVLVCLLAMVLIFGSVAAAAAEPYFSVSPIDPADHMWGEEWQPDSEVLIEVDDPDEVGPVDFSMTTQTDGNGRFELYDLPFDLEAGQTVTVTQDTTRKTHDVIDLGISDVNTVDDTVTGWGAPNRLTYVNELAEGGFQVITMSDGSGVWMADFGASGFDVLPRMTIYAFQADEDWDQTQIDEGDEPPSFMVLQAPDGTATEAVVSFDFQEGSMLTLEVDNGADGTVDYTTSAPAGENGHYIFDAWGLFTARAGDIVRVYDDLEPPNVCETVVRHLTLTGLDNATDSVSGTASPGAVIAIYAEPMVADDDMYVLVGEVTADSSGNWSTVVSYDLMPFVEGFVFVKENEGQWGGHTQINWRIWPMEGWQHNPANGHEYLRVYDSMSWSNAQAYAVSLGGNLVSISDAAEYDWLLNTFGTEYWIGLNDMATEGVWTWSSGDPVTFTDWLPGEPNDLFGEDAAYLTAVTGQVGWNDMSEGTEAGFVVEVGGSTTLGELLDDMVDDGRIPDAGLATSLMKQVQKAPLKAVTNHLASLVSDGIITQQTMDQILAMFAS